MSKYQIPTPQEVDYYNTKELDEIMELIIKAIKDRKFQFVPRQGWVAHYSDIQKQLSEHWLLKSEWMGSRESGQTIWKLTPKI